jgi:hypothetical protein
MKKEKARGPLSNAERQARFRTKRDARLKALENIQLRNGIQVRPSKSLRNDVCLTEETLDERLIEIRQVIDAAVAQYIAVLDEPGLTIAEARTVSHRFVEWRARFDKSAKGSERRLQDGIVSGKKMPVRKQAK